jgi:hypothetical protein
MCVAIFGLAANHWSTEHTLPFKGAVSKSGPKAQR